MARYKSGPWEGGHFDAPHSSNETLNIPIINNNAKNNVQLDFTLLAMVINFVNLMES